MVSCGKQANYLKDSFCSIVPVVLCIFPRDFCSTFHSRAFYIYNLKIAKTLSCFKSTKLFHLSTFGKKCIFCNQLSFYHLNWIDTHTQIFMSLMPFKVFSMFVQESTQLMSLASLRFLCYAAVPNMVPFRDLRLQISLFGHADGSYKIYSSRDLVDTG